MLDIHFRFEKFVRELKEFKDKSRIFILIRNVNETEYKEGDLIDAVIDDKRLILHVRGVFGSPKYVNYLKKFLSDVSEVKEVDVILEDDEESVLSMGRLESWENRDSDLYLKCVFYLKKFE